MRKYYNNCRNLTANLFILLRSANSISVKYISKEKFEKTNWCFNDEGHLFPFSCMNNRKIQKVPLYLRSLTSALWERKILLCIGWKIILWNNSSYIRCLAGYPYKPPKLYLKAKEGLSEDDLQALHSLLIDQVWISQVAFLYYSRMNHSAPNANADEYNNWKFHVIVAHLSILSLLTHETAVFAGSINFQRR